MSSGHLGRASSFSGAERSVSVVSTGLREAPGAAWISHSTTGGPGGSCRRWQREEGLWSGKQTSFTGRALRHECGTARRSARGCRVTEGAFRDGAVAGRCTPRSRGRSSPVEERFPATQFAHVDLEYLLTRRIGSKLGGSVASAERAPRLCTYRPAPGNATHPSAGSRSTESSPRYAAHPPGERSSLPCRAMADCLAEGGCAGLSRCRFRMMCVRFSRDVRFHSPDGQTGSIDHEWS